MKIMIKRLVFVFVTAALLLSCTDTQNQTESGNGQTEQERQQEATSKDLQTTPPEVLKSEQPDAAEQEQPGAQMHPSAGEQIQIAGTVESSAEGFVIRSDGESHRVTGKDLSDWVGKNVRVSGVLAVGGSTRTIEIHDVQVVD